MQAVNEVQPLSKIINKCNAFAEFVSVRIFLQNTAAAT